ncbi:MAG TPA: hypothetical protein VGG33_24520 [Polyangia bacterium]
MASTRPASKRGTWFVLAAVVAAGTSCTSPNPFFVRGDGGDAASQGGQNIAPSGGGGFSGSDAVSPAPDTAMNGDLPPFGTGGVAWGTGGSLGTGGTTTPGTGGIIMPGTGGASGTGGVRMDAGVEVGSGGTGGTMTIDTAPPVDTSVGTGMPPAACGTTNVDLSNIRNARGLAIESDGTLYFTRESGGQAWIGRMKPTGTTESSWFVLPPNSQPRVIRVDSARRVLFVAAYNVNAVYGIRLDNAAVAFAQTGVAQPHGLAVTPDGGVFVSVGDGHIRHVLPELAGTVNTQATTAAVFPTGQRPLGLAIGPNGRLFVGSSNGGIKQYRVEGTKLLDGTSYGSFAGTANDLAFDVSGRLYVADHIDMTARLLVLLGNGGSPLMPLPQVTGRLSALAFGRGALRCDDLLIGDAAGITHRLTATAPGLALP